MKNTVKDVLGISSLIIFILTASISFVIFFRPLYSWIAQGQDIAASLDMSHQRLMANYNVMLDYLIYPWIDQLKFPDFPASKSGLFHFYEVKILFMVNFLACFLTGLASFFYIRFIKKTDRYYRLIRPFQWAMIVPFILMGLIALNFDRVFVIFHELLFNNDAWLFDYRTDPIILALPQSFFAWCFAIVLILVVAGFYFVYRWSKIKTVQKKSL